MATIFLAYHGGLAVLKPVQGTWQADIHLLGHDCHALAVDPHRPGRVYCGTFDAGLWLSDDGGQQWQPAPGTLPHEAVMAVAVSPHQAVNGYGVLWAGTEPSALFRSEDGGRNWVERPGLRRLPSASTWSFPPRPWTHHVRWIEPDLAQPGRLFVGIELGGVMRSLDDGETWEDRKPNSQHDCHTLRTHPQAPGTLYEAAGGGFAASYDGGATWHREDEGMAHHYCWGLAVDPADPRTLVVSASPGPRQAHQDSAAQATLYRRSGDGPWQPVHEGLPPSRGTRAYVLATHATEPGIFYAATRQRLFRSTDAGQSWEEIPVAWPDGVHFNTVNALVLHAVPG